VEKYRNPGNFKLENYKFEDLAIESGEIS